MVMGLAFMTIPTGKFMLFWRNFWALALCVPVFVLSGCDLHDDPETTYQPTYSKIAANARVRQEIRVGIHPLHNPELLFERYGPIVDVLNERVPGAHFVLEASRNYQEFENKLAANGLDVAMPNPYQTLQSLKQGYRVFGKMAGDDVFRGLVLVRKDSRIDSAGALRGKLISFPSSTALAATMQPQFELYREGLEWGSYEPLYVGSQESSIMNVLHGHTSAGATWPTPWLAFSREFPEQADQLDVLLATPPLINNAWVALESLEPELVQQVGDVLFSLHQDEQGRKILAALPLEQFEPASNEDYEIVRNFLRMFSQHVRPVEP